LIFVWLSLVLLLSIIPTRDLQTGYPTDKVIHFVIYGITAVMFLRILRFKTSLTKSIVLSIILASMYGFVMELLQSAIPWRKYSFSDMMSNVSGAVFFSLLYVLKEFCRKKI
jgi:VanZ family protein